MISVCDQWQNVHTVKPWVLIGFISFLFICVFYPHKLGKIHQFGNVAQRNWESRNAKKHENTAPHNHWKKGWAMVVLMRGLSERPPYTQKRNHHRLFTFCLLHDLSLLPGGHIYWSCLIMSPLKGWPTWCSYTYLPGKCWGHIPECIFFVTQLMRGNVVKLGLYLFCCWCSSSCAFS